MGTDCNSEIDQLDTFEVLLGWFLLVGTFISNVPQYHAIISRKSSYGMSIGNQFIFQIQSWSNFAAAFLLERWKVDCCFNGAWYWTMCLNQTLVASQLMVNFISMLITFVLYLAYHSPNPDLDVDVKPRESYKFAMLMFNLTNIFVLVTTGVALALFFTTGMDSIYLDGMADGMGITSAVGMLIGNLPQIITTYRLKRVGSNSILMNLLQAPGIVLLAVFQSMANGNWFLTATAWIGAFLLFILLIELSYYAYREWKENKERSKLPLLTEDSSRPLLTNEH